MKSKQIKRRELNRSITAIYIRVSTQRQAVEGDSLEAQENAAYSYLEYKGIDRATVRLFVDGGKSAKDQNRPELQRLRAEISSGEVKRVIVFKLDRLTRSLLDFVDLWELFSTNDVQFISIREDFDTSHPMGEAMIKLIMIFAELERRLTAERTLATMLDRARRGLWNGVSPLGYITDPENPGKLIVELDEATLIRLYIFDAYEKLGSIGAVQRHLRKNGITVPARVSKYGKARGGNHFQKQQIRRILSNRIYIGTMEWGGETCEEVCEAIIAKQQFERVQIQLEKTEQSRTNLKANEGRCYPLSGLLRCSCGAALTPTSSQSKGRIYFYYKCTRQSHYGTKTDCSTPSIPAEALEEAVIERVTCLAVEPIHRQRVIEEAYRSLDQDSEKIAADIDTVRKRLTTVQTEIGNLVSALSSLGSSGVESVQDKLVALEAERATLEERLKVLVDQRSPHERIDKAAREFTETWGDLGDLLTGAEAQEKKEILHNVIESIELTFLDAAEKRAEYRMNVYPEFRPGGSGPKGPAPETPKLGAPLTTDAKLRQVGEKAPRNQRSRQQVSVCRFRVSEMRSSVYVISVRFGLAV